MDVWFEQNSVTHKRTHKNKQARTTFNSKFSWVNLSLEPRCLSMSHDTSKQTRVEWKYSAGEIRERHHSSEFARGVTSVSGTGRTGGEQLLHKLPQIVTSQKRRTKTRSFRLWVSTTCLHSTLGWVLLCVLRFNGDHRTATATVFDDAVQSANTSSQPTLRREKRVTRSRTVPVFYSVFFCRKSETLLAAMCIIYFYIICIIMYIFIFIYIYIIGAKESYIYTYIVHIWAHHKSLHSFLHSAFLYFPSKYLLKVP